MSQLDAMYDEFANLCTYEDFVQMFQRCTHERHNFMSIDLNASDPLLQFRKCFDEMIIPKSSIDESDLIDLNSNHKNKKQRS